MTAGSQRYNLYKALDLRVGGYPAECGRVGGASMSLHRVYPDAFYPHFCRDDCVIK